MSNFMRLLLEEIALTGHSCSLIEHKSGQDAQAGFDGKKGCSVNFVKNYCICGGFPNQNKLNLQRKPEFHHGESIK